MKLVSTDRMLILQVRLHVVHSTKTNIQMKLSRLFVEMQSTSQCYQQLENNY